MSAFYAVFNQAEQLTDFIGIQKTASAQVAAKQRVSVLQKQLQQLGAELAALKI